MKTSFSVKVSGSITVSIEPSNEDGGGGGGAAANVDVDDSGNVLVDVLLKSLVNDAVKKYVRDKGTTVEEEEEDDDEDHDDDPSSLMPHRCIGLSTPMPHRRISSDADDDADGGEDGREDGELQGSEADNEAAKLPTVQIDNEYEETKYRLSQKMDTLSLRLSS